MLFCNFFFHFFSRQEELKRVERERQAKYKKQREVSHYLPLSQFNSKLHCKKRLSFFPSPAGMSLATLFLAGNNLLVTSRLGTGKTMTFFHSVLRELLYQFLAFLEFLVVNQAHKVYNKKNSYSKLLSFTFSLLFLPFSKPNVHYT
jgi:hypothetical protein